MSSATSNPSTAFVQLVLIEGWRVKQYSLVSWWTGPLAVLPGTGRCRAVGLMRATHVGEQFYNRLDRSVLALLSHYVRSEPFVSRVPQQDLIQFLTE